MINKKEQRELRKEVEQARQRIMNRIILENPSISLAELNEQVYEEMVNPVFDVQVNEIVFADDMDEIDRRNINKIIEARQEEVVQEPKRRNSRAKAVVCLTTGKTFASIKEAAAYYGMKTGSGISKCCKGQQKTSGKHNGQKLVWQFV